MKPAGLIGVFLLCEDALMLVTVIPVQSAAV